MSWLAWRMLTGDRTKYLGIVFGVAFGSLLIAQQSSIFVGVMRRTSSVILDLTDADVWVMDPRAQNVDEIRPMPDSRLYQVRGVPGVQWAVRLYKGLQRVRLDDGRFRQVTLLGLDDGSLVGVSHQMVLGQPADLRRPDGAFVDQAGFRLLFPGEPLSLGKTLEINDRRRSSWAFAWRIRRSIHSPWSTRADSQATQFAPRTQLPVVHFGESPAGDRARRVMPMHQLVH